jgi:hypothetical protein
MVEYILFGSGFAFAAAVSPGPLQAFYLSNVAQRGWQRTLPSSFAPLISDGPIALLTILFLESIPEIISRILHAAGGIFLIYLAWASFRSWAKQPATGSETQSSGSCQRCGIDLRLLCNDGHRPCMYYSSFWNNTLSWTERQAHPCSCISIDARGAGCISDCIKCFKGKSRIAIAWDIIGCILPQSFFSAPCPS